MDLANIKKFMLSRGDRLIFMQDGEPEMVVMSFSEYEKLATGSAEIRPVGAVGEKFDAPEESPGWAYGQAMEAEFEVPEAPEPKTETAPRLDQIRLEDLPL